MKQALMIILLILSMSASLFQEKAFADVDDKKLINWMRANICLSTGMPYSFEPLGIKKDVFGKIGSQYSTTGIIERTIVDRGVSIYDAALWQIALSSSGNPQDWVMAYKPIEYYWNGSLGDFFDIRTGSDNQIFIYDPKNPEAVTSDLSKKGRRGFIFRILNAEGKYLSTDPFDEKTKYDDYPNDARLHWEDWKPIAGENAWVAIAAMHLLEHKAKKEWSDSLELKLAQELARAAIYLQAENGGIRMAPLGTYYHLLDISSSVSDEKIVQALDERAHLFKHGLSVSTKDVERLGGVEYPPYQTWYFEEISTENNISWYAAFRELYHITGQFEYLNAMQGIERYLKSVWDPKNKIFYQGAHFKKGIWVSNIDPFASDVQNWSIIVLGPQKIDEWFGEGSAVAIWQKTKLFSAVYGPDGLRGIGFTKENNRLSIEWTAGAILAMRKLTAYYLSIYPDWAKEARRDAISMRLGIDDYYFNVKLNEAAYSYSSIRHWIPFGWFSHDVKVLSLASTAWIFLIDKNIDPFKFQE